MSEAIKNQFHPNYAVPPGETLLETLETMGMSQAELAARTGRPRKTINEIIHGKASITSETALQFERVLGVSASFWNNLERQYQETCARLEEQSRLSRQVQWLSTFPIKEMVGHGWIRRHEDKVHQLREVLNFLGVASPERWKEWWRSLEVSLRKSQLKVERRGSIAAWLRMGELEARKVQTCSYDPKRFRSALLDVRRMTTQRPDRFQSMVTQLCADAGVVVVFIPELTLTGIHGATRWLAPDRAMIQLSLRYKTDDQLWFSFFHEAAHILLHGKKNIFIESNQEDDGPEKDANSFAAEWLIPRKAMEHFLSTAGNGISKGAIRRFAKQLEIAPGIVVGQLQHRGNLPHSYCNDLKRRFRWAERE